MTGNCSAMRLLLAALGLLPASSAHAQSLRDFDYSRPYRGERELRADISFAAGKLLLAPGSSTQLYRMTLRYDAERFQPVGSYDAGAGVVKLGVESNGGGGIRVGMKSALSQTATLGLSKSVALALDLTLGAAEAQLELGDYRISELNLKSGASRLEVSFAKPNPGTCRTVSVSSGAGEVTILHAGNSGCAAWHFDGGVGSVTVGLDGAWRTDSQIQLSMALGGVTLQAPQGLGIRVTMNGFLASFDATGFSKHGKSYTSVGYERATRKVDVFVNSALGGVKVEWQ